MFKYWNNNKGNNQRKVMKHIVRNKIIPSISNIFLLLNKKWYKLLVYKFLALVEIKE